MTCFYCGCDSSSSRDHVVPVSYQSESRDYKKGDIVLCCKECNSLLGNKPIFTVEERADYLSRRIYQKYKKHIESPSWSDEELLDMSPEFQKSIKSTMMISEWAKSRVAHCVKVSLEMYDDAEIEHLTFGKTVRDAVSFKFISIYCESKGADKQAFEKAMQLSGLSRELAKSVISSRDYESAWLTYKYNSGVKVDAPRRKVRTVMQQRLRLIH